MVSSGCYLVVEDGIADLGGEEVGRRCGNQIPQIGGPLVAIQEELIGAEGWYRDRSIEDLTPVSHHPAGWWVRD
jgi:cephalosporin hydroxylase